MTRVISGAYNTGIYVPQIVPVPPSDPVTALTTSWFRADMSFNLTGALVDDWTDQQAVSTVAGTLLQRPTAIIDGSGNQVFRFDGGNNYLTDSTSAMPALFQPNDLHMLVRMSTAAVPRGIMSFGRNVNSWNKDCWNFRMWNPGGGGRAFEYDNTVSITNDRQMTSTPLVANVTATYEVQVRRGAFNDIIFRVNGVDDASGLQAWAGALPAAFDRFTVGAHAGGLAQTSLFQGDIYAIALYAGTLSAPDATTIRNFMTTTWP